MPQQKDFDSLLGPSVFAEGNPRRTFIQTAIGAGFAAAALPTCAQSLIQTDATGLSAGVIMLDVYGQQVPVYRAQPEGKTNLPIVLVVSEIFGVHEHIADVVRRFAKQGYLALAPELFVRQGDAGKYANIAELMKEVIAKVADAQVMQDLDATLAWAKAHGGNSEKLAITGFCWGGRITWLYAAHNPQVKTAAAWYGRLNGSSSARSPLHPLDITSNITVPVLGLYGAKDSGISLASVEQMKQALALGKSGSELMLFANSGHAFHADYRPSYVAADAKEAWQHCLAWFKTHLN